MLPLLRDTPSPARCFTGTVCSLGFFTFLLSLGVSAHCVARATPEACSLKVSLVAINAAVWGLILIIVGGMCLTFYDCFRIEPVGSRTPEEAAEEAAEPRWKPNLERFGRLSSDDDQEDPVEGRQRGPAPA